MRAKDTYQYLLISGDYERKKLDVNLLLVLILALVVAIAVYAIALPFQKTFIGILLYQRGFTQYLAIYLSAIVVTLTVIKFLKLQQEMTALSKQWIPESITFENSRSRELLVLQKNLAKHSRLLAIRCGRVIGAYIQSGSRKTSTELALDDSTFYLSASESSYTFPRVIVWSIPLLGFIGTVVGISQAVSGFSSFLEKAGEIDQIKEGIGTVTSGLAVAFDTTLLALLLSVLVMIPLVLVERLESRFLLRMDIYINDTLIPRLQEKSDEVETVGINQSIRQALKDYLPSPEALIEPAHNYAKQAVDSLSTSFINEVEKLQQFNSKLIEQMAQVNQMTIEDRSKFIDILEDQLSVNRELSQSMIVEIQKIKPILEKLSKPRMITFTDAEDL